jgi:hypothetical protein
MKTNINKELKGTVNAPQQNQQRKGHCLEAQQGIKQNHEKGKGLKECYFN